RDVDLLDGTPVLDIKPYVPYADAFPESGSGWLAADPRPAWQVDFTAHATSRLDWLASRTALPLRERIGTMLALGSQPHPYRRIRRRGDRSTLSVQDWRADFRVDGERIEVLTLRSGYQQAQLQKSARQSDDPLRVHREFIARFGPD